MASNADPPPPTAAPPRVDSAVSSAHKALAEVFTKARKKKHGTQITRFCRRKMGLSPSAAVAESMDVDAPVTVDVDASASMAATAIVASEAAASVRHIPSTDDEPSQPTIGPTLPMLSLMTVEEHLSMLSELTWDTSLRPLQLLALSQLLGLDLRKLLVVQKTGGGKTHIVRTLGTLLKGIHVVLHPLLALTGDQLSRFQEGSSRYGRIEAVNLDARGKNSRWRKRFIKHIAEMSKSTTSTLFVFTSPQFLADNKDVRNAIINVCLNKRTFRSFTIDEAHLLAQHGSSFRSEIRLVCEEFIKPIFGGEKKDDVYRPFFLAMSATVSLQDMTTLGSLTGVGFPKEYRFWGDFDHFAMDNCEIQIRIGSEYTKNLDIIVAHLSENDSAAFAFTNGRALSFHLVDGLEGKLDKHEITADVVHIHGRLRLDDKCNFSKLYCRKINVPTYHHRVLVATSAADLGIDHPDAQCGLNNEWPDSISTFVQRRGRASRRDEIALIVVIAGIASFVQLTKRIYSNVDIHNNDDDEDKTTSGYTNLLVTPSKGPSTTQRKRDKKYKLSKTQREHLVKRQHGDLMDVLDLFCLDRGCIQRRIQMYLSVGRLVDYPDEVPPCGNCCHCKSKKEKGWGHYFLPVRREGVLELLTHSGRFPCNATYDSLLDIVWSNDKREHWIKRIFDEPTSKVCKYNVEAMMLQLIAARFIVISDDLFVLGRESSSHAFPPFKFEFTGNWTGIRLATGPRKLNDTEDEE